MTTRCYVGLGANLGQRALTLRSAIEQLAQRAELRAVSPTFESAALGPPQPDYLNCAVAIDWVGDAPTLLATLHAIEAAHGRVRGERWGARTLDLDLVLFGGLVSTDPACAVPHPGLLRRTFVLLPLAHIAPSAIIAGTANTVAEALAALGPLQGIARYLGPDAPIAFAERTNHAVGA